MQIVIRRFFSAHEVSDRLAMMADEIHEHVADIAGDENVETPRKRGSMTLKRSESVRDREERRGSHWEEEREKGRGKAEGRARRRGFHLAPV